MAHIKLNLSGHINQDLDSEGFLFPGALHVDLSDPDLPTKIVTFLSPLMDSGDHVTVAVPGLSTLTALVITAVHGLTGQFPSVQSLVKDKDGSFVRGQLFDLQSIRNDTFRASRGNVVMI